MSKSVLISLFRAASARPTEVIERELIWSQTDGCIWWLYVAVGDDNISNVSCPCWESVYRGTGTNEWVTPPPQVTAAINGRNVSVVYEERHRDFSAFLREELDPHRSRNSTWELAGTTTKSVREMLTFHLSRVTSFLCLIFACDRRVQVLSRHWRLRRSPVIRFLVSSSR